MKNKTVFVLLAGGKSDRMGVAKGLLKFNKTFWILEQLQRISKTSISEAYIGLGYNYHHYFDAINWFEDATIKPVQFLNLNVTIIINDTPSIGSFSTLLKVINRVSSKSEILLNPIDVPLTHKSDLQKIIGNKKTIVIPNFNGKNGHPIKMNYTFWNELKSLNPLDSNSRLDLQIKKTNCSKISQITVSNNTILLNLNTPKEWEKFLINSEI